MYRIVELLCCMPDTNVILYVNYALIKQTNTTKESYFKSKTLYDVGLQNHISTKRTFSRMTGYRMKYCRDLRSRLRSWQTEILFLLYCEQSLAALEFFLPLLDAILCPEKQTATPSPFE